jgi:hypothetical protein
MNCPHCGQELSELALKRDQLIHINRLLELNGISIPTPVETPVVGMGGMGQMQPDIVTPNLDSGDTVSAFLLSRHAALTSEIEAAQ